MYEDKLKPEQRIRLESVNQANQRLAASPGGRMAQDPVGQLLTEAMRVEQYIRDGADLLIETLRVEQHIRDGAGEAPRT